MKRKHPTWGGRRAGSGRKPNGPKAGVWHLTRERVRHLPVHVSWEMKVDSGDLRQSKCSKVLAEAFAAARDRFGMRILHSSVQGNHLHLIVEADDNDALSKGMQGLGVRVARSLNRVLKRRGRQLADRYQAQVLRTPAELKKAVQSVSK